MGSRPQSACRLVERWDHHDGARFDDIADAGPGVVCCDQLGILGREAESLGDHSEGVTLDGCVDLGGVSGGEHRGVRVDLCVCVDITGVRNDDGSMTGRFGDHDSVPNSIPIIDGWNYLIRLYRSRTEIIDGSWSFPTINSPS